MKKRRVAKKTNKTRAKSKKRNSDIKEFESLLASANSLRITDPKKALGIIKRGLSLTRRIKYRKGIADSHLTIAHCYAHISEFHRARENYEKAVELYAALGEQRGHAYSLLGIGTILNETGAYRQSLAYYMEALKIFEDSGNKEGTANALTNIGVLTSRLKEFEKGIEYFLQALKFYNAVHDDRHIAITYLNVGANFDEIGDHERALRYFLKSLKIFSAINDKKGCALCYQNLGECYALRDSHDKALNCLTNAIGIFNSIGDKYGVARTSITAGQVHLEMHEHRKAHDYLKQSLQHAEEIGSKDVQIESHENLARLFEETGDYKQALHHHRHYHKISQEVFSATKSKQIANMRIRYETEQKEKEAEIYHLKTIKLRQEVKRRRTAEKELKEHRDHLEQLVEERTVELRNLTHELSLVEERQRRKIATYLHDDISQALALATLRLEQLQGEKSIAGIRKALQEIQEITDQTNQRTRSLTFEISPPILYDLGLEPALEWFAEQFSKRHAIPCDFQTDRQAKLMSDDTKVILFQSVRELLTNIRKHAQATRVKISALHDNNTIRIRVEDNGIGFDHRILKRKTKKNEGFGLFNLNERLRHLGGKLDVSSKIGKGTSVILVAPLASPRRKRQKEN